MVTSPGRCRPQTAVTPAVSDPETQEAVASVLPEVEIGSSTILPLATFLDESMENQETGLPFSAEVIYPEDDQVLEDDLTDSTIFFHGAPSQWDDSPTGRLLQEAREQAMAGMENGYRVDFSATRCILVTKKEALTLPDGREHSLISTWLSPSVPQ